MHLFKFHLILVALLAGCSKDNGPSESQTHAAVKKETSEKPKPANDPKPAQLKVVSEEPRGSNRSLLVRLDVSTSGMDFIQNELLNGLMTETKPAIGYHVSLVYVSAVPQASNDRRVEVFGKLQSKLVASLRTYIDQNSIQPLAYHIGQAYMFPGNFRVLALAPVENSDQHLRQFQSSVFHQVQQMIQSENFGNTLKISGLSHPDQYTPHISVHNAPKKNPALSTEDFEKLQMGLDANIQSYRNAGKSTAIDLSPVVITY